MTTSRSASTAGENKPLVSYDASSEFQYNVAPRIRSDHGGAGIPFPGKIEEGPGLSTLKDWNRGVSFDVNSGIFIGGQSLYSILEEQLIAQQGMLDEEWDPKTNKDYYDLILVGNKPQFKSMDGLKNFMSNYLFNQAPANTRDQLQLFAVENLHQSGLPYAAELQFTPDRVPWQTQMLPVNIRIDYTPTATGVTFKTTSSHRMQYQQPESPPAIRFETESEIAIKAGVVLPPKGKIHVDIYEEKLKNYALGRGYMGNILKEYRDNRENYHPNSAKKVILDELMEKMQVLFNQKKQEELVSLFYIYSALKEMDFSNQYSIDMFKKAVADNEGNLSANNKNIYEKVYKDLARPLPDENQQAEVSKKRSWKNIISNISRHSTQPSADEKAQMEIPKEKSWQSIFSDLHIKVANTNISIFDSPAFILPIINYCKDISMTTENMNFLVELRSMILYPESFDAKKLMDLYIRQDSPFPLNLKSEVRLALEEAFKNGVVDKNTGMTRPISIDDFKKAAIEIVMLMNRDVLIRAQNDKSIKIVNLDEVVTKLPNALRSAMNPIDAAIVNSEFNKILETEKPQLKDLMNLKKKLINAVEHCSDKNQKEILQRAIGVADTQWRPSFDYERVKVFFEVKPDSEVKDNSKGTDKMIQLALHTTCKAIYENLETIYKTLDTNDPVQLLDFQRKAMMANELMNTIANTAKKGVDEKKALALVSLMTNFHHEIAQNVKGEYRKSHDVTDLCESMKKHVNTNSKALGVQSKLSRMVNRNNPEPVNRLVTYYDGVINECKQEQNKLKKNEPKKVELEVKQAPRSLGM